MRKAILGLVVVLAAAVLVDFTAAAYSEYRLSRWLRTGTNLRSDPQVTFHGFPFLWQARSGKFEHIEFRAIERSESRTGTFLTAQLEGVHISISDLLQGAAGKVPVDHIEASVRIDETELGRILGVPDLQITKPSSDRVALPEIGEPDPRSQYAVLTGTDPVTTGDPVKINVLAQITVLPNSRVSITAIRTIPDQGVVLEPAPPADDPELLARFTRTLNTTVLPFAARPTEINVQGTQVVIKGTIDNRTVALDQLLTAD